MSVRKNGTDTMIRTNGKVVSPALARSVSLHLEGKRKEALKELNSAIESGEETAGSIRCQGTHSVQNLEQYEDAIKTYEKLLGAAPRHPTAHFNLGICYEKLARWQEATVHGFQKGWLETDPEREEAQLGLGICLLHQEKPEPAIVCFDKVLGRHAEHETALFGKAVSLQLLWKFDEATSLYLKILQKNPQSEECLVNLITIGMARKDHAAIQQYSERLLAMRPFSQAALEGLATCAFQSNEYEAAARYCTQVS